MTKKQFAERPHDLQTKTFLQHIAKQKIIDLWKEACNEGKELILVMDDNIDTNITNNSTTNTSLLSMIDNHLNSHNIARLNTDNTHFCTNQAPCSIDHFYSNIPDKISSVTTHNHIITDHKVISAIFNHNKQIYTPKFIRTKNYSLLTRTSLVQTLKQ